MTHIESHGLLRPLSPPAPVLPRGPLPRPRGFRDGGRIPGAQQAGLGGPPHTSVFALRVKPPGGADASGFSFCILRFIYERIALGSGKRRRGASFPSTPGAWDVQDPVPRPRAPPPGSLRPRLSEAGPAPEPQAPSPLGCQLFARLCQSLGGDSAPRARPIGRRLCDVTACSPNPPPVPSRGCPLPPLS